MRGLLSLPPSLLLILAASTCLDLAAAVAPQRVHDILSSQSHILKRPQEPPVPCDATVLQRLAYQAPVAVRKMSADAGEKFYPEYWQYHVEEEAEQERGPHLQSAAQDLGNRANQSLALYLLPPLLQHAEELVTFPHRPQILPRNFFEKRDYKCPSGTDSCSSIGYSNSCCSTDETCVLITDTGLGPVGCCPDGDRCSGSISTCNISAGYTSCPNSSNGGCCIPGYSCDSIGCVASAATTITSTVSTLSTTSSTILSVTSSPSTTYIGPVTTTTVVDTEITTISSSSSIEVLTIYLTITTPTSTDYVGGISTATTTIFTTLTEAGPAVRPTSDSEDMTISTSTTIISTSTSTLGSSLFTTTTTTTNNYCPTGYYQCSAYYDGGCCQVGRNCDSTSCPATASTAIVTNSIVTIIVATGDGVTTVTQNSVDPTSTSETSETMDTTSAVVLTSTTTLATSTGVVDSGTATCARGWYSCAAADGGGCCPTGYSCAASCIATQTGEPGHVYKVAPNHATSLCLKAWGKSLMGLAGLISVGMIWL